MIIPGTAVRRLAGFLWLLLLPAIDIALVARYSPRLGGNGVNALMETHVLPTFAIIMFWAGVFLLTFGLLSEAQAAGSRGLQRVVRLLVRAMLAAMHLYFLVVWGFMVTSGHLPNPESITFLIDNAARVPQHIVQTSPVFAAGVLGMAILSALFTERAISSRVGVVLARDRRQVAFAGVLFIVGWYAAVPLGATYSPAAYALAGESQEKASARTALYLDTLAQRSGNVTSRVGEKRFPVIVLLVESLRYDLLTKSPDAIPFLKSLVDDQVGFDYSYATASHSNLTDLAFWYSQYPLRGDGMESFPEDAPWRGTSLFRVFKDAGYPTAYISSQNERWGNMINWLKNSDVDYFFDSENFSGETWENFDDINGLGGMLKRGLVTAGKVEDSQTLKIASNWISKRAGKSGFFLGLNLQNTHFSYVMPPGGIEPYQPSDLGFKAIYYSWPESQKANVKNRYLNAVTNVDRLLKEFSEHLKREGLWDECLFVVVGDNGEGFYEHGFGNHSGPMYDEAVRTFSVVKLPKSLHQKAVKVASPISHIDIAATIPQVAGLSVPETFQGQAIDFSSPPQRPVFMYSNAIVRQYGIVRWPWKLMLTERPEGRVELYRLDSDPSEAKDLASSASHKAESVQLTSALRHWISVQRAYYESSAYRDKVPPKYVSGEGQGNAEVLRRTGSR